MGKVQKPKNTFRFYFRTYMLLGLSVFSASLACRDIYIIWTPKSSLIKISGTLQSADNYRKIVTDRRRHKSQVIELVFYLKESNKKFSIVENIGQDSYSEKLSDVLKKLHATKNLSIWIRKDEYNSFEPKIFQIDGDKNIILPMEKLKSEKRPFAAFMILLSFCSLFLFLWFKYPEKVKLFFK